MIDKTYMTRHLTIDRYLQGNLSDEEIIEFESRLAWDQELGEDLDLAERLQFGLRKLEANGDISVNNSVSGVSRLVERVSTATLGSHSR